MTIAQSLSSADTCPLVVLDTNVILDLWLFEDLRATGLRAALRAGRLRALLTAPMLAELADVLQRPFVANWPVPAGQVLAEVESVCQQVLPAIGDGRPAPRCTDAADQKFIDLAWAWPTQWLISRDRAVLKLARPALARGLHIVTPERWTDLAA